MNEEFDNKREAIIQIVNAIPYGKVATYGQIAKLAGLGRAARFVGTCMKNLPKNTRLPWHRVINAKGQLSFPFDSEGYLQQKQRLMAEGIGFSGRKIDVTRFAWKTDK